MDRRLKSFKPPSTDHALEKMHQHKPQVHVDVQLRIRGITNKLRHPKTFQLLTVKTERFRKTFIPYCLRHYQ